MSDHASLKELLDSLINSPGAAATISASTTIIAGMSAANLVHGIIVNVSMMCGVVVTVLLGRVHWIKYKLLKRAYDRPDGELPKGM